MSSLYYSGDTGTNRGTSLRRPGDARRRAQIRSDVLCQAAEDLTAEEQAQVEHYDPLYRNKGLSLLSCLAMSCGCIVLMGVTQPSCFGYG
jgi:hypothetical protein